MHRYTCTCTINISLYHTFFLAYYFNRLVQNYRSIYLYTSIQHAPANNWRNNVCEYIRGINTAKINDAELNSSPGKHTVARSVIFKQSKMIFMNPNMGMKTSHSPQPLQQYPSLFYKDFLIGL